LTFSSTRRFCGGALVVLAFICLSSCAVPLAPGYQIEKQSITVRFVPGAPPHLAIRAQYRLANVGTAPLDSVELGLPSEKGFGLANLRVKIDGREVTPQRERSETSAPAEGETAVAETWPSTWRIPFESRWSRRQRKNLVLEYDLTATPAPDPRMSIAANAFYLNDSGWFPDPISIKALLATDVVRPDPSDLIVDVPANFVATASGEPRGTHKTGNETELRFLLHKDDFDPYVAAGQYQQQTVSTAGASVVIWTFKPITAEQAQITATPIAAAMKFYSQTFGSPPKNMKAIIVADLNAESAFTDATILPGVVFNEILQQRDGFDVRLVLQIHELDLADTWFGHMITPRADAWLLADAISAYAFSLSSGVSKDNKMEWSRSVQGLLQDYDRHTSKAVEKPMISLISTDSPEQVLIGDAKAELFMFALEDKCGRENLEHAIAHMVYALRGQEYGYMDLRAALEQECHQDLSSVFATWLDQTGIPADFRARCENATSK